MNASASSTCSASTGPGEVARHGALLGVAGEGPGEHGLGDARDRHAQVQGGLHGPRAGALGSGLVEDHIHERLAGLRVHLAEHFGGDLDQVGLQLALVPLGEHVRDLGGGLAGAAADQVVRLRDQLHVGVLDAVVHHLHEMPGAIVADMGDARLTLRDRRDALQDRSQGDPGLVRTAGHDRRAVQGALLAAGDAGADEVDPGLPDRLLAADRVGEQRVPAVDDDVARLEHIHQRIDHGIRGLAGLDHDDRRARLLQGRRELLVRRRPARTPPRDAPPPASRSWRGCG